MIKRYDPCQTHGDDQGVEIEMLEDSRWGEWVSYADHCFVVATLEQELQRLRGREDYLLTSPAMDLNYLNRLEEQL